MTNRLALTILALLVIGFILDQVMGWGAALFLARKFIDLVEWLAFWR